MKRPGLAVVIVLGLVAGAAVVTWWWPAPPPRPAIRVPMLSAEAEAGRRAFDLACARCHGEHGVGSRTGPALVDPIYRPAHHADIAFELAVRRGVRAHHARFGDMPPQPAATAAEIAAITRYLRELQRSNGIH